MKKNYILILFMLFIGFGAIAQPKEFNRQEQRMVNLDSINILDAYLRDYYIKASGKTVLLGDYSAGFTFNTPAELPSQTGKNAKYLTTNGTTPTWADITVSMGAPSYNNSITSGTAFQPSSTNASQILISSVLSGGVLGLSGTSVIAMSPTQSGTYTNIGNGTSFYLAAASLTDNKDAAMISVPKGYWVKVTNTAVGLGATLTSNYTRWNL